MSASRAALALHERDAEAGERAELGADDHRSDDQDHRVLEDPERGDHRREHHEGDEAEGQLRALGRLELDRLPDDCVGRRPDGCLLGAARRIGDHRRDRLEDDRALALQPERAQLGDDEARVLACNVAEDEIAVGSLGGVAQADHVERRGMVADDAVARHRRGRAARRGAGAPSPRIVGMGPTADVSGASRLRART